MSARTGLERFSGCVEAFGPAGVFEKETGPICVASKKSPLRKVERRNWPVCRKCRRSIFVTQAGDLEDFGCQKEWKCCDILPSPQVLIILISLHVCDGDLNFFTE
jgi:hypothetical protein